MARLTRRQFIGTGMAATPLTLTSAAIAAQGAAPTGLSVEKNVVFGKGGATDLHLDIYRPPAAITKRMATIHIHGGGFTGGSKETLVERVPPFAARGYVALAVQYRLADAAKYPSQIEDVKAAIRWTRAHASSLGIDADKIAVVGYSAGGNLALFAAATPDDPAFEGTGGTPGVSTRVAACCAYYPASELRRRPDGTPHPLLPAGHNDDAAHRAASPVTHIKAGFPPTVIFHGTADTTVPLEMSQRLFKQLLDLKVPAELHAIEGVPHIFDSNREYAESAAALADFFLDRQIVRPRKWAPSGGAGSR